MEDTPRYTHDCDQCTFLGCFHEFDLYFGHPSLIARYGNKGEEYYSWEAGIPTSREAIKECEKRAVEKGLVTLKPKFTATILWRTQKGSTSLSSEDTLEACLDRANMVAIRMCKKFGFSPFAIEVTSI